MSIQEVCKLETIIDVDGIGFCLETKVHINGKELTQEQKGAFFQGLTSGIAPIFKQLEELLKVAAKQI